MFLRTCALMLCGVAAAQSVYALTIDTINVSTVNGYGDTHSPTEYPGYDRFSILGAAYTYSLSDGQVRPFGAGWIPYTNGHLASVAVENGVVRYGFDQVSNWAWGQGTIFYSVGQVWCSSCGETGAGLWTEGRFVPVSPIVLTASLGSATATLTGTARIAMNNASGNWGLPENFLPFSSPEGSVVSYSATYTLTDGSTWDADVFDRRFTYNMIGAIDLLIVPMPVPEPGTWALMVLGLGVIGANRRRSKRAER
ncbi:PEPxxWA-CTERM sorting domain-containing protein [Pseudorhodoferax sp. Leaf274]|uniref:PEPxxWA-CTERM sorting domain-containing protein n=1 Tax=Pseudorhodoferax sp. Leaf274 TaxID=1736318 RepID=UPI000702A9F5|nr:PEPxxWA-CTERM sorting domain-containing protein [Pseudorhodoferax sp. Leaf274]KQP40989.1 hypothetical protein ASF44_30415 [Pseudorhodoferax sp. Leaf274]